MLYWSAHRQPSPQMPTEIRFCRYQTICVHYKKPPTCWGSSERLGGIFRTFFPVKQTWQKTVTRFGDFISLRNAFYFISLPQTFKIRLGNFEPHISSRSPLKKKTLVQIAMTFLFGNEGSPNVDWIFASWECLDSQNYNLNQAIAQHVPSKQPVICLVWNSFSGWKLNNSKPQFHLHCRWSAQRPWEIPHGDRGRSAFYPCKVGPW